MPYNMHPTLHSLTQTQEKGIMFTCCSLSIVQHATVTSPPGTLLEVEMEMVEMLVEMLSSPCKDNNLDLNVSETNGIRSLEMKAGEPTHTLQNWWAPSGQSQQLQMPENSHLEDLSLTTLVSSQRRQGSICTTSGS